MSIRVAQRDAGGGVWRAPNPACAGTLEDYLIAKSVCNCTAVEISNSFKRLRWRRTP